MPAKIIPVRSEQKAENCWAVTDIYPNDAAWERDLEACQSLPQEIASYEGKLGSSAQVLHEYLQKMEAIHVRAEKLYVYAMLRSDEDTANGVYQAMKGRCFSFLVQLNTAGAFEGPELVAIDEDVLQGFYAEEPGLEKYRRYLTKARLSREHILSPGEEVLLAGASEIGSAPGNIFNVFTNADMVFPDAVDEAGKPHPLTNGSYISLMEGADRALRADAFRKFYGVYGGFEQTLAATYDAEVKKNLFFARARKYASALESALSPNEVPVEVYRNLVDAVREALPHLHRYMALRKKAMGLDQLHMYDIYADMIPEAQTKLTYDQACEEVLAATAVLGEDYSRVLRRAFDKRWIDRYENKGKRSGAYSCSCPTVHPFVLLNHQDTLDGAFTIAHEMGHAMHSWLSEQTQPPIYSDYVLFVAEVASTCNESLLMHHLLEKTADKAQRAALLNHFLEQFRTTVYRQTMFAEFEMKTHELAEQGQTLTAEVLKDLYRQLNRDYYGPDVVVDEEIAMEWARIPHFYMHFYVYQYATGFAAAMALSERLRKEGGEAVEDYLRFLSGGCSMDPVSLLKVAGVDMSTPQPVKAALTLFGSLIDELETLLED